MDHAKESALHNLTLGDDVFNVLSVQLTNDLVEPVVVRLDAHAVQDFLDVLGAGGGIAPEGGQQVGGNVAHLGDGGEASRVRPQQRPEGKRRRRRGGRR